MEVENPLSTAEWERVTRRGSNREKGGIANGTQGQRPTLSAITNISNGTVNGDSGEEYESLNVVKDNGASMEGVSKPVENGKRHTYEALSRGPGTNGVHVSDATETVNESLERIPEVHSSSNLADVTADKGSSRPSTVNGEPQHIADSDLSAPAGLLQRRRSSSMRKLQEKEKVLKLSPAKMEELMSSPDSIPVRAITDSDDSGPPSSTARLSPWAKAGPGGQSLPGVGMRRSFSETKPGSMAGPRSQDPKARLDEPPDFLVSSADRPGQNSLRNRSQSTRNVSSPTTVNEKEGLRGDDNLVSSTTSRPKPDRPRPNHIQLDKKAIDPSLPGANVPSPMPQSIPLPPLSLPTYLQLELSSDRPSPLYIHHSSSTDFPYESSRVKMERLLNFLLLPPALEQVLWFGAMACMDAWLYSFTILPLRFVKALCILITSWTLNLWAEVQYISSYIVNGVGRVWKRRQRSTACENGKSSTKEKNRRGTISNQPAQSDRSKSSAMTRPDSSRFRQPPIQKHRRQKSIPSALLPDHKADILKGCLMVATCIILMRFDASRMYHWIRGQAAVKLYVIYNVLEVTDRLFSAIGQDVLECLFSMEALERKPNGRSKVLRPFSLFILALIYTVIHSMSLFFQVITLNVAVNSYSNALITLLLSNQFVEIKSTVFKKIEKENLFQLTCADVVERFQLWLMLTIIASRNIVETSAFSFWGTLGWNFTGNSSASTNSTPLSTPPRSATSILPQSFTFFPTSIFSSLSGANFILPTIAQVFGPFLVVLGSEMLVDWLKHAYINKFNNTRPAIYGRFLDVLAKDYYTNAFGDQNLTRRLGLPVIPLSCLFFRVSVQTYQMFLAAWLPPYPASPSQTTTSLSSIHKYYSASTDAASSLPPLTLKNAIPTAFNYMYSLCRTLLNEATPSPASSTVWFTVLLVLTGYVILLLIKLALGILLLSYARARYKMMKRRETEYFLGTSSTTKDVPPPPSFSVPSSATPVSGTTTNQSQPPRSAKEARQSNTNKEHIVEGGRRVGGWGVVEVGEDRRRWIYADDPDGLRKLKEREERDRNSSSKDKGYPFSFEGVHRYEMVAKRIW